MHPQVIMDHEGDCPICGMKLVAMEAARGPAQPAAAPDKGKILFYRNPMDPTITSPVFMKDCHGHGLRARLRERRCKAAETAGPA